MSCFSEDAVYLALKGEESGTSWSGDIFSAFAHQGQQPIKHSTRAHSNTKFHAHITKWVAESNRPANIISDPELINLFTTGHPHLKVPSPNTV
ncbi:hypothetical protein BJV78DRAFT_1290402 [Lactifluus subvellereus]|nr:hypothetical protein BJV78DRAFT_1290402 [Lactifluus subvellereus]